MKQRRRKRPRIITKRNVIFVNDVLGGSSRGFDDLNTQAILAKNIVIVHIGCLTTSIIVNTSTAEAAHLLLVQFLQGSKNIYTVCLYCIVTFI